MTAPDGPKAAASVRVRLYVAGESPNSTAALANLRSAIAQVSARVDIEVIDILSDPMRCLRDGIVMTPMLVRYLPAPERRVLGNLRDRAMLLGVLGLEARSGE